MTFAVQRAVRDVEECNATDIEPLGHTLDTDALEAFFDVEPGRMDDRHLSFEYAGHSIHIEGTGHVYVD